jgi:hypothetical protein
MNSKQINNSINAIDWCKYGEQQVEKRELIGEIEDKIICYRCVLKTFSDPNILLRGGKLPTIKVFEDPFSKK